LSLHSPITCPSLRLFYHPADNLRFCLPRNDLIINKCYNTVSVEKLNLSCIIGI